jgi:glycerol uptake facilitator-like aquaporin
MAQRLSPGDLGQQLLQNSLATALALGVLITALGPVSGAHLNPAVSLADWWASRGTDQGLQLTEVAAYGAAQVVGGLGGAVVANVMFDVPTALAVTERSGIGQMVGEVVATAGLVALVLTLVRTARTHLAAPAVAAWIGSAIWFTSSTSFANPAVTVGRMISDTFTGIAPSDAPAFVLAQLVGAALGVAIVAALHPLPARGAVDRGPVAIEV